VTVFPNPSTNGAVFKIELERSDYVQLDIFDVQGRVVSRVASSTVPAGEASLRWRPEALADGVYFYRLRIGEDTATGKLLLLGR
jgi:hypothetical protein